MRVKNTEKYVEQVLREDIATRNCKHLLYVKVAYKINPMLSTCNFKDIFLNYKDYGIPAFVTVDRNQRKIIEKYPELDASEDVKKARDEKEEEYIQYALDM